MAILRIGADSLFIRSALDGFPRFSFWEGKKNLPSAAWCRKDSIMNSSARPPINIHSRNLVTSTLSIRKDGILLCCSRERQKVSMLFRCSGGRKILRHTILLSRTHHQFRSALVSQSFIDFQSPSFCGSFFETAELPPCSLQNSPLSLLTRKRVTNRLATPRNSPRL